jgi:hypothetical protein
MEALKISKTDSTPEVVMDKQTGVFMIRGNSLPEDVLSFYKPVHQWLTEYFENANSETEINFRLDYMNTASSKMVMELIKVANIFSLKGGTVKIIWHYMDGDDDSLEAGTDFESLVKVPFEYKKFM